MNKVERVESELLPIVQAFLRGGNHEQLEEYLRSNSNLPGPRGNIELAAAFGNIIERIFEGNEKRLWDLCLEFVGKRAATAPVNSPAEFLPFCGTVALGSIAKCSTDYYRRAFEKILEQSNDPRWRVREAVAMAFERAVSSPNRSILKDMESALDGASWLEMRGIVAGLAHPSLLEDVDTALLALDFHRRIISRVEEVGDSDDDSLKTLVKGLSYTLSVVVVAVPEEGFEYLEDLAKSRNRYVRKVLKENLKKKRLTSRFPSEVSRVLGRLSS